MGIGDDFVLPSLDRSALKRARSSAGVGQRKNASQLPTPGQRATLPLHVGNVPCFDAARLAASLPPPLQQRLHRLEGWVFYPALKEWRASAAGREWRRRFSLPPSNLTPAQLQLLTDAGVVELDPEVRSADADADDEPPLCCCFSVVEERKGRLRCICWTAEANEVFCWQAAREPRLRLPGVRDVVRAALCDGGVICEDMKAAFYQRVIPPSARCNFRFFACDRWWRMARLPMGHSGACAVTQIYNLAAASAGRLSRFVVGSEPEVSAVCRCGVSGGRGAHCLHLDAYIDNTRIYGTPQEEVVEAQRRMHAWCASTNVTLNADDSVTEATPAVYSFVGVAFDGQWVRAADRTADRLRGFAARLRSGAVATLGEAEAELGRATWAAQIPGLSLAAFLPAVLLLRKAANAVSRGLHRGTPLRWTTSEREHVANFCEVSIQPHRVTAPAATSGVPTVIYSDASERGRGTVILSPTGRIWSFGGRWPPDLQAHITALEALALRDALLDFERLLQRDELPADAPLELAVDSTAVEWATRRAKTNSEALAPIVTDILKILEARTWTIRGVRSADNPADEPSRQPEAFSTPVVMQKIEAESKRYAQG